MDNYSTVITLVGIGFTMVSVLLGVIFWTRGEANALRAEANADRRDIVNLVLSIKDDIQAIQLEMKDFHGRLCAIEERGRHGK